MFRNELLEEVTRIIYPLIFKAFMEGYNGDMYYGWVDYILHVGPLLTVIIKVSDDKSNI